MKAHEWSEIERRAPLLPPVPEEYSNNVVERSADVARRDDCEASSEVQILTDGYFTGPDIAMSPVVSSTGAISDVSIASGYQVSNTITVTAGGSLTVIEKVLELSLSVSYARQWTTSETTTLRFTMVANQYGLIVSQPSVRRVTGNLLSGCTDNPTAVPFLSDTYEDQSYGHLSWVKGVIRLCNSTVYPVPYCSGEGTHA
ncbi:hypothetical protein LZ32DRAFT_538579 [Colletotrichum eremochloae]|nr:hypothetical protein LZ32DRAFT_538579 [Colletotrichum eremochloae]